MSHTRRKQVRLGVKVLTTLFLLISGIAGLRPIAAQSAESLSQVKRVYVASFGQGLDTVKLRERIVQQLKQRAKLEVVDAPADADAIIRGEGSVWITGYVTNDVRSPSNSRQPILRGYLSMEVTGKNDEPLWSYLVTPSGFILGDITKDLADHLVAKFVAAVAQKGEHRAESAFSQSTAQITLTAAGATFPAPLYIRWFELFHELHPNLSVAYRAVGSGQGIDLLLNGKLDFGASDMPLSDEKMAQANRKILHIASVIGAVVPAYNLKGVGKPLNFTPEILAGIYLGKIKKWNDPEIRELNRNLSLPEADIVVFHRSDGSGTTYAFTDYLSKVSQEWKASVGSGTTVLWPVGTGEQGNEGVATAVQQTPNAIGYVESVYALRHELNYGAVRNAAGQFVQADLPSITSAATEAATSMSADTRVSITNPSGKNDYPIATFTWWLVPQDLATGDKRTAFLELLRWMLTSGQKECSALGYAPLPRDVANRELQLADGFR